MDLDLIAFGVLAGVTVLSGLGVVMTRNVIYAALFLLAALLGVAGLFVLLFAEFLALVQIFIYGGAVIIVILFALMLTRTGEFQVATENRRAPFAAAVSLALFAVLTYVFISDAGLYNADVRAGIAFAEFGRLLFVDWTGPFVIASFVLLISLIGAVVLARTAGNVEEEDGPLPEEAFAPPQPARPQRRERRQLVGAGGRRSGRGAR